LYLDDLKIKIIQEIRSIEKRLSFCISVEGDTFEQYFVTIYESVSGCSFSMMVRWLFSLFNTVYIGMVTHERTEDQCPVII